MVEDPDAFTRIIFAAVEATGVRALVSAGWSKLGGKDIPDNVHLLGNVPHEWLFSNDRVSAVCHHGGAGTTACGIRHGRPTIIFPILNDNSGAVELSRNPVHLDRSKHIALRTCSCARMCCPEWSISPMCPRPTTPPTLSPGPSPGTRFRVTSSVWVSQGEMGGGVSDISHVTPPKLSLLALFPSLLLIVKHTLSRS